MFYVPTSIISGFTLYCEGYAGCMNHSTTVLLNSVYCVRQSAGLTRRLEHSGVTVRSRRATKAREVSSCPTTERATPKRSCLSLCGYNSYDATHTHHVVTSQTHTKTHLTTGGSGGGFRRSNVRRQRRSTQRTRGEQLTTRYHWERHDGDKDGRRRGTRRTATRKRRSQ